MKKGDDDAKAAALGATVSGPTDQPTLNSPGFASTAPITSETRAAAETSGPRLSDGEVVAGRYRIVRYIARGGMGEVYEAEDLELGERVALKTIREETRDPVAEERFKREIQLSRKVTHPNVCRIFDVGYHVRDDGSRVVFLTMELLMGETLLDRIRQRGQVPIAEAAMLLRQISAGLSAAHAVGVVHRDLKSGNVILVPRKGGGVRAVVTDFGLAHVLGGGGEERARSLSGSSGIVGTPGYMAPEQVEGGELSNRTDVYALGVVMYEMLTSKLPFDGTTPLSIAAKRLTTPAPSPKKLRPELPPRWEKAVLACLERDPASRPASARAVAELVGLVSDSLEEIDGTIRIEKETSRTRLWIVVGVALALIGSVTAIVVHRARARPRAGVRRAIAAVPFHPADAASGAEKWIGEFASALISVRLAEGQALQTFEHASIVASLIDIGIAAGDQLRRADLDRLRALLSLDLIVTGRYQIAGSMLTVDAELRDAARDARIAVVSERGTTEDIAGVLGRVADRIARAAGVEQRETGRGLGVTLPTRPAMLRAFVEARERYDRREVGEAAEIAERALRSDVDQADTARLRLLLAEARSNLGDERGAIAEGKRALAWAPKLPRLERLFVEAVVAGINHDRAGAITRYEQLRAEVPTDLEIGWRLVEQLDGAGRSSDALKVIEQLRRDAVPRILGATLDLYEVDAREVLGDLTHALEIAERAAATADELGGRMLRANARYKQCRVLESLHRLEDARRACEETRRTASEAGDQRLRAFAVNLVANIDFALGHLDAARRGYEDVLPIFRDLGDRAGESIALNNLGNILNANLDREGAAKLWQESLAITDEFQDPLSGAPTRENLSEYYAEKLDWSRAISYAEDAQRAWRSTDEPNALIEATCRVTSYYLEVGRGRDVDRQLDDLDALMARLATPPPPNLTCVVLRADVEYGRGHLERSIALLRAETERMRDTHEDMGRVMVGFMLAHLLDDAGDRAAALAVLTELGQRTAPRSDEALLRAARILRARIELETGALPRAGVRLHGLEQEVAAEASLRSRMTEEVELERLRARIGDRPGAIRRLQALADRAMKAGAVSVALEAELRAQQLRAEGKKPASRAEVVEYARRARLAGRPGWADRAERLLERPLGQ